MAVEQSKSYAVEVQKTYRYEGFYRGKVENIKDDPLGLNRIQIRIMGLHSQNTDKSDPGDGIPTTELPWAEQASPLFGGFSGDANKSGLTNIPSVGSWVWLFFENANHNHPIYFASIPTKNDMTDVDTDVPDEVSTILTKSGHKITISDKSGEEEISITSGKNSNVIKIDDNGDKIAVDSPSGEVEIKGADKVTIDSQNGNVEIQGSSDNAVRYSKLESAFNKLKSDFNTLVSTYTGHVHPGVMAGPGSTGNTPAIGIPSTADISPAKISNIKVPMS